MKRFGTLLSIMLMACIPLVSRAAIDMTITFEGPIGISFTADYNGTPLESSGGQLGFEASAEGYVEIQTLIGGINHSLYRLTLNGSGAFTAVEWKPDVNSEYQTVNAGRYALANGDSWISFHTFGADISHNERTETIEAYALNPGDNSNFFLEEGFATLLPGHFVAYLPETQSYIRFLIDDDLNIDEGVLWKKESMTASEWQPLHVDAFDIPSATTLSLSGVEFRFLFPALTSQNHYMIGSPTDPTARWQFNANEENLANLLPGICEVSITQNDPITSTEIEIARFRFQVLNETNRLDNEIKWIDLVGSRTNSTWATLQPGIAYLTPLKMAFTLKPPFDITGTNSMPYAVLKDKLDQGYYLAQDGVLRLRYDERYDGLSALDLRILDMDNQEITLSSPVSRQYGTNWIELTLPSSGFTVGDFYVLEVRSEKGDLGLLRFRYDN